MLGNTTDCGCTDRLQYFSPPYPDKFKPGDTAIAKHLVIFSNGTSHLPGERIVVTQDDFNYYNVCHKCYDKQEG